MAENAATAAGVEQLTAFFRRNGYVRRQNSDRLGAEGYRSYKKGDEVRLIAESVVELRLLRRLLKVAKFTPGRPYAKARQWCQPIYGRRAVARFLILVGEPDAQPRVAPSAPRG